MARGSWMITLIGLINIANGLITDFNSIEKSGFKSEWDRRDPSYYQYGYDVVFASGKIFVVGQRRIRSDTDDSRHTGGIVSAYDLNRNTWSHYQHGLDIGAAEYRIFTLNFRLHMLTYINLYSTIHYQKLFAWDERSNRWTEVPLDAPRSVVHSNRPPNVYVSVPDQSGGAAYLIASSSINGTNAGAIHRLSITIDLSGNTIKGSLTLVVRVPHRDMKDLVFATSKDSMNVLQTFGRYDYTFPQYPPYWRIYARFSVDIRSQNIKYYPIEDGPFLDKDFRSDHVFQSKNRVVFIGFYPMGRGSNVPHLWIYDLDKFSVKDRNAAIPYLPLAVDQKRGLIYAVDSNGITMAKLMD